MTDHSAEKPTHSAATAWIVFGLILALFCLFQDGDDAQRNLGHGRGTGVVAQGASALGGIADAGSALRPVPEKGDGMNIVEGLTPWSPLYIAGARDGDLARFDRPYDSGRAMAAGDRFGVTLYPAGQNSRHVTVTAVQTPWTQADEDNKAGAVVLDLILASSILTGAFILLRSRGQPGFILLGLAFICFGNRGSTPEFPIDSAVWPYVSALCALTLRVMPALFLAFAVTFHEQTTGRKWPWLRRTAWGFGALLIAAGSYYSYASQVFITRPIVGTGIHLYVWVYFLNLAFIAGIFLHGLRHSDQGARRRYVLMLIAILMVMMARGTGWIGVLLNANNLHAYFLLHFDNPLEILTSTLALIGPLLFAYAALRNKVLDIGFAVNRALVYGAVSTVLLIGFGLIEWASEHFIPIEGKEKNALIDAAIALTVFLTFHRLRDVVEKIVERLFFRRWHHNEAKLRTFVDQASFFTETAPLIAGFTTELKRFCGGADGALYQRDEGGRFTRTAGHLKGAAKHIDANDALAIALRAERKRIDLDHGPAALALPMVHRAEVSGFVLLGAKPSGNDYRPDEKDLLGWAAHQIGLDLHALQVEALQTRVATLDIEVKTLRSVINTPA